MIIKDHFELIYKADTPVFNIFPYSSSTLNAYLLDKDTRTYLLTLAKAYEKTRSNEYTKLISKYLDEITFVNIPDYVLPGFITKEGNPYANIAPLNITLLSDFAPADIYSMIFYSVVLSRYCKYKPFSLGIEEPISIFFLSIFMKLFGKKSGLVGSYKDLIPSLRFLISMYIRQGLLGMRVDKDFMNNKGTSYSIDYNRLKLDYDFSNIKDFLRSINDNRIIAISENKFSQSIINIGGINSLPMFEDVSRLYSTLASSVLSGNKLFSNFWIKISKDIFNKMLSYGLENLRKAV